MPNLIDQEYAEKLKIKIKLEKNFNDKIEGNSLKSFGRIQKYLKGRSYFIDRGIVGAHLDFEPIVESIAKKEPFYIVSGKNPSGPLHLGHIALFKLLLDLQKMGGEVIIPLTNDESYVDGKVNSLIEGKEIAYEIIPFLIALGFDPDKTKFFVHTDYLDLYKIALYFGKYVNTKKLKAVFGEEAISNSSKHFFRGALQLASILMPQLEEFGGKQNVLIPVSADQHPYVLMARKVAKSMGYVPPSELVIQFLLGHKNPLEKMSGSKEGTAIMVTDSTEEIRAIIQGSYSGSLSTLEGHKKHGAIPEICPIFQILRYHHPNTEYIDEIYDNYKSGDLLTSELKGIVSEFVIDMLEDLNRKAEKIDEEVIEEFLLKQKIESI